MRFTTKALLVLATSALTACAGGQDDTANNAAQADTSIDIDAQTVTVTGRLTVNGQSPADAPVPGAATSLVVWLRSVSDPNVVASVQVPPGATTYSLEVSPGSYFPQLGASSEKIGLPSGQHQYPKHTVDKNHTTLDLDLPLVKLTTNLTLNGQPLENVAGLQFTETSTHESFLFVEGLGGGAALKNLQPFEAYFVPGTYAVVAEIQGPSGSETYTLSPKLKIQ